MIYIADKLDAYKLKVHDGKVYDPVRDKYVFLTPEEDVRQRMILYLLQEMKVPAERIVVERTLSGFGVTGSKKRIDIGILQKSGRLEMVVECKAYGIRYSEAPFQQAIDYVRALNVKIYIVTDGDYCECYCYDDKKDQFVKMDWIPGKDD